VNQIEVNPAAGLTFPIALRHILRHDPDVIMIGEVRDFETAKIAVESSLTGHLVLSTLHTNNAASAVTRLLEIGIEPSLVTTSLMAVLAQRLVRRNCQSCLEVETVAPGVRQALGVEASERFVRGRGCSQCHGSGYSGRRAVYELLMVSAALRQLIAAQASSADIEACAIREGMQPLTHNALELARNGETSLAEVYRIRLT
jgi:type IV pilus assembly protein PilB